MFIELTETGASGAAGKRETLDDKHGRPLFILSFRQRDELAAMAARAGWRPVAARRDEGVSRRFVASGAGVIVIDARGATSEGLTAARHIQGAGAIEGRALLVLVSRNDIGLLDAFYAAGATHFLASPMKEAEFVAALRFAGRHAERVSGGWIAEGTVIEPLGWRYDPARRSLQMSPRLARTLGVKASGALTAALRWMAEERTGLIDAVRRLQDRDSTAYAHDAPGVGRVVHHLKRDARTGRVHAVVEPLGTIPNTDAAARDLFPRRARSVAALARDLPQALADNELDVLFQPQVEIASGRIVGVEALARWQHPRLGEVGAEALFAAADRAGRAVEVSALLQTQALNAAAAWPEMLAGLRLSINVTPADIAGEGFVDRMIARVASSGFAFDRLTLEVTEGALVEELGDAARALSMLREAGCRIAIDDFGTGYSSLSYLNTLPLDYLKLDKRMTHDIVGSARERVVVRGVIAMAHSLGLAVIAEGVETEAQRALLAAERCGLYQGYLCARPIGSEALAALVADGST